MNKILEDGTELVADGLQPVGHCTHCRLIQTRVFFLDGKPYCITCFPLEVNLKAALGKLHSKGDRDEG